MSGITSQFWQWVAGLVAAVLMLVGGFFVLPKLWGRIVRLRWWLAGLGVLVLVAVFLIVLPRKVPVESLPIATLPKMFRLGYWAWALVFLLGALGSTLSLVGFLRTRRQAVPTVENFENEHAKRPATAELDAAWEEIRVQLEQARIDLGTQRVYLLLAPSEEWADALVQSTGVQIFAQLPERPAPFHAYATSDAVFLSCAGASAFGTQAEGASALLEHLGRKLLACAPDCPNVRGIAVLFPIGWAALPESVRMASAIRDDLQALQRALGIRLPVFALFTGMEAVPGFLEFMRRLSDQVAPRMLDQRVGFAVPSSHPFSGDLVQRGLVWISSWFHSWILNLLSGDITNQSGNAALVTLDGEIRRYRKRLKAILESAFSTHRESEPVQFRGCYFMATGPDRREHGFSAGLLRGARSRIVSDHIMSDWAEDARRADRRYARIALTVGLVGGLLSLLIWLYIARLTPLGWLGLVILVIVWVVTLLRVRIF